MPKVTAVLSHSPSTVSTKLSDGTVCPECRAPHKAPNGNVKNFTTNRYALEKLEQATNSELPYKR